MNLEISCPDLKELCVIDEKLLYNAIINQGPKGEEGRLFKLQGIVYEEITHLRLDFLDILKIDHLWMMTGLTKLQLNNNFIEKIENLDELVNLTELDLSFNYIERIENLNTLLKLEVLTLYQNKIQILENLEHLKNLTVLSVGNNLIQNKDSVLYLREFASLKSLNMAGNPICEEETFKSFIIAYIPQLVYYEYHLITETQREEARNLFLDDLIKLERAEDELNVAKAAKLLEEEQERLNAKAFVGYLGGNQLFLSMFETDTDCKILLGMGDSAMDLYNEFNRNFTNVTKELHAFGLKQSELRKAEIERFEKYVGAAKNRAYEESREITEDFLQQKNALFSELREILNSEVEDDEQAQEVTSRVQDIRGSFRSLCSTTWVSLMKKELILYEAMEEVNGTYERALTELVNQFVEGAQAQFTQLRQLQGAFNEALTDLSTKFFTNFTVATATNAATSDFKNIPRNLVKIMQDKEFLTNALSTSHDLHLLVIDQREDKLISEVRGWLANLVENVMSSEVNRNRNTVIEINHLVDTQKEELQSLLSTPVGLLLMPRDLQDALSLM